MCGCLLSTPPGVLVCNPGLCPEWEQNRRAFGSQVSTQSPEPHQPGLFTLISNESKSVKIQQQQYISIKSQNTFNNKNASLIQSECCGLVVFSGRILLLKGCRVLALVVCSPYLKKNDSSLSHLALGSFVGSKLRYSEVASELVFVCTSPGKETVGCWSQEEGKITQLRQHFMLRWNRFPLF